MIGELVFQVHDREFKGGIDSVPGGISFEYPSSDAVVRR